jgi:hypothetical protein
MASALAIYVRKYDAPLMSSTEPLATPLHSWPDRQRAAARRARRSADRRHVGRSHRAQVDDRDDRRAILRGIVVAISAPMIWLLIAGRFVIGLGVGAASHTVPLYIGEVAPPAARGRLVSMLPLLISTEILGAYDRDAGESDSGESHGGESQRTGVPV